MAQTFFKVLAPQDALKILLDVTSVGEEQISSVMARGRGPSDRGDSLIFKIR